MLPGGNVSINTGSNSYLNVAFVILNTTVAAKDSYFIQLFITLQFLCDS